MKTIRKLLRRVALTALLALLVPLQAHADCTAASPMPAAFGTVTSFVVKNQAQSTSSSNIGLSCGGALAAFLVVGNYINGTISSANGGVLAGPTGDKITYSIFADKNYSTQLNFGQTNNWASTQFLSFIGIGGGSSVPLPLYLRTGVGANESVSNTTMAGLAPGAPLVRICSCEPVGPRVGPTIVAWIGGTKTKPGLCPRL